MHADRPFSLDTVECVMKLLLCFAASITCLVATAQDANVAAADSATRPTANEIEQNMADEERAAAVSDAIQNAKTLEASVKQAQRAKDGPRAKELRARLADAKKEIERIRGLEDEYFLTRARLKIKAAAAKAEEEQAVKDSGPVVIRRMGITYNVINLPELSLVVENSEEVAIEAFEIEAECFNKFGEPVVVPGQTHVFKGSSQKRLDAKASQAVSWQLSLQRTAAKATVWVSRVLMADGRVLTFTKQQAQKKPYGIANARLVE